MKNFLFVFIVLFGFTGVLVTAPTVEAACSYNGYLNSGGRCGVSWTTPVPYQWQVQNQYRYVSSTNIEYLQNYILQLQALIRQLEQMQSGVWYPDVTPGVSAVTVRTVRATGVDDERATLRGEVDFRREDEATVYFEWGTAANALRFETTHVILDEDDDDEDFEVILTGLQDNRTYYFRAVAEDERGRPAYGATLSFRTDDEDYDDWDEYPDVSTYSAQDIEDDRAELRGRVDMQDAEDGRVFFVYGESESRVSDVPQRYTRYSSIAERGDDLQKVLIDTRLDGVRTYETRVTGLDDDTRIYYRLCVEFTDEDDDDRIICGSVRSFMTED